jgi:hypothetical protein
MTQDKFVQARRRKESMRASTTDDNEAWADLDKSDVKVIYAQLLRIGSEITVSILTVMKNEYQPR